MNWKITEVLSLAHPRGTFQAAICLLRQDHTALSPAALLHPQEIEFYSAIKVEKRRQSYLLGRLAVKEACQSLYPQFSDPKQILVSSGVFHQPLVSIPGMANVQISLSHSGPYAAAIAFPEAHPMAIDLEISDPKKEATIQDYLTQKEKQTLSVQGSTPLLSPTLIWTAKEALSKAIKTGLMIDFELLETGNLTQQENRITGAYTHFPQYTFTSFNQGKLFCTLVTPEKTNWDSAGLAKKIMRFTTA